MRARTPVAATATLFFIFGVVGIPSAFAGCPDFAATYHHAGWDPRFVAVGDFNGDGKPDFAVASIGSGSAWITPQHSNVSVLLGNGDGTFTYPVDYPVGSDPSASGIIVEDFNGDGKSDVAVTNAGSDNVSILLGRGDGTLTPAVNYAAGDHPMSLASGDFNRDGKPDLVIADADSGNVSILLGAGDGTFAAPAPYGAGLEPFSVAVGEFNGDGKADLAVVNHGSSSVSVLMGNGNGTFAEAVNYATWGEPIAVVVGDLNGDGKADLAVANYTSFRVKIFFGSGQGAFTPGEAIGDYPYSVVIGDFNGDGKADLAVGNFGHENSISIMPGSGKGTFASKVDFGLGIAVTSMAAADFNGDGEPDLVAVNAEAWSDGVMVLLSTSVCSNQCSTAEETYGAGSTPEAVVAGDFNKDGKPDLAVANHDSNGVSVLLGSGEGMLATAVNYAAGSNPHSLAIGDFNGDGKDDLAVANSGSDNVSILLGVGNGTFVSAVNYGAGGVPMSVAVADFNRDGKTDLAVANAASGSVSILFGNGDGTLAQTVNYSAGANPYSVAIGDFNRDGRADLAVANHGSDDVSILLGNGDGTFAAAVNYRAGSAPFSLAVGDFNRDGRADLAVANASSNNVSILLGSGTGTFSAAVNYTAGTLPTSVAVGDLNGDGKADLAVANFNSNNVSVLAGRGDGTFTTAVSNGAGSAPFSVVVGDFDFNGKQDFAVVNRGSDDVSILLQMCPVSDLTITTTETSRFVQYQIGAAYTLTVSNAGTGPTIGTVTVVFTITPPQPGPSLIPTAIGGTGWTCTLETLTCTRSDALAGGTSYPPITVTVDVSGDAPLYVTYSASVSGGGEVNSANDIAIGQTLIAPVADLIVTKTHSGAFLLGQIGATYAIEVTTRGNRTSGIVTVTDTLPAGLSATGISGTGWSCDLGTLTCTRSDSTIPPVPYPPITLTVNVASDAPPNVINVATVSGGGEVNTANDTASDPTTIMQSLDLSITATHARAFILGPSGGTYTLTVHNAGPGQTSGTVTVVDTLPAGLTVSGVTAPGWGWTLPLSFSRNDPLAAGATYPAITITVNVASGAAASVTNMATVSAGGDVNTANNTASDLTRISASLPIRFDLNRDGTSDVIWRKSDTGENAMWLMHGVTIMAPLRLPTVSDTHWKLGGVGDFNADKSNDLIWLHDLSGDVVIWLMNGTTVGTPVVVANVADTNWKIAGVGDADNDGKADVFWRNEVTGEIVVWLMDSLRVRSAAYLAATDLNWNVVGVGDFNGDGKSDLMWRNKATGENVIWLMNGTSIGSANFTDMVADLNYKVVGVGDLDGDYRADVVWRNQATGDVVVWLMNGATISSASLVTTVNDLNWHMDATGDFDGDGTADLFWCKETTGETVVWLMDGFRLKQAAYVTTVNDLNWSVVAPR